MTTINDIKNAGYQAHHTSWTRRYVSRKCDGVVETYDGRFGKGYAVYTPSFKSTQYCYITYYVAA